MPGLRSAAASRMRNYLVCEASGHISGQELKEPCNAVRSAM